MASRAFKLPLRTHHDNVDPDSDTESTPLSTSPTLVQDTTSNSTTSHSARDDRDDLRRTSFLRRRFSSIWAQKKEGASDDDVRGPLGLRLLSASPEPMIEVIFVHGLRGGSVKTWQKGRDPRLFWPQHWLPMEAEFRNASIHSFGYDSDWKSSERSPLSINDFGQALYEEMRSSPFLRRNSKSPIILVGHSMGGLVIKKAHILACRNRDHCDISNRIRSIFFLATPHKGSDYAALLNNILKVSGVAGLSSSREYLDDLAVGSKSTQLINEEFINYASNLAIFSFYETMQTNIGLSSSIIVDKESAVLGPGYHNERVTYINANHGNVCKYSDPSDSNYLTLKNALGAIVQDQLADALLQAERHSSVNLRSIRSFLGVNDHLGDRHDKLEGSCQWIDDREDFKDWRDSTHDFDKTKKYKPSVYWVTANPGAGKTVLVEHIESQLEEFGLHHAAYYFHFGKKESQSLSGLLRSLAFQMARSNAAVREVLTKVCDDVSTFDLDDARAIWSKVFRAGIFLVPILTPQYWVIDAIDECIKSTELFSLLKGTPIAFPLKIFITSRKLSEMPKMVRQLNDVSLSVVEIPVADTMRDIELYISSRIADLPVDSDREKADLTNEMIAKSNACFLWVRLVMDELEGVYGYESILEVLRGIPESMVSYYRRTVNDMAQNKREKHISKAILQWVTLAARPLTTSELAHALGMDVKTHLSSPKPAIEGLCGHLVSIDADCDHVRIVHSTAREFLFSDEAGEFKISKTEGHERIAQVCLKLLCGPEMQPPRHRRLLEQKRPSITPKIPALLDYAIMHFYDHVFSASAKSDELLAALAKFLSATTTSWIEKIARTGDAHRLIRAARNLKAYLDRRSKYSSPLDRHVACVDAWATDLSRIAIKFGAALITCPHAIYFLIPPLCPTQSAIYRQFRRAPDSLTLSGVTNQTWEDCVATLAFGDETAATVASGENLVAVGFESGNISFYNHRSHEVETVMHNQLSVDMLCFDPQGAFLAVSSRKFLSMWDLQGNLLWRVRIRARLLLLTFAPTCVLGVTQQGKVLKWEIETGELVEERTFTYQHPNSSAASHSKAPSAASISPNLELLTLAYRNGPVCLFDLESTELIGWAIDSSNRGPDKLIFNPNPDVNLLLVAYNESHLSLFDSWSATLVHEYEPETHAVLNSITCSPSGHTFATVDIQGTLRIWDFESLSVLYHVATPNHSFRLLRFTSDAFNLLDVTDHEMKVWSPSALVRKTVEEGASTSDQPDIVQVPQGQFERLQLSRIRTMASRPDHPVIFSGKSNGDVTAHSSKDSRQTTVLYTHQDTVGYIASCEGNIIASSDLLNIIQVCQLEVSTSGAVSAGKITHSIRIASSVRQLLLNNSGQYLLVSTTKSDHVYRTKDGFFVGSMNWDQDARSAWKWCLAKGHERDDTFALVCDQNLSFYEPSLFPQMYSTRKILLDYGLTQGFTAVAINSAIIDLMAMQLILEVAQQSGHTLKSLVSVYQLQSQAATQTSPLQPYASIPSGIFKCLLGVSQLDKRLIFLSKQSWVCTIAPATSPVTEYTRHFFVPNEYTTTSNEVVPVQASGGAFAFCLFNKLGIVANGLQFHEVTAIGIN